MIRIKRKLRPGLIWGEIPMMGSADRWQFLEGLEPESAISVAVKHLAGLVADELLEWPPRVAPTEGYFQDRFAELLEPGAARPSRSAFEEAIRCARWDIARDFAAIEAVSGRGQARTSERRGRVLGDMNERSE